MTTDAPNLPLTQNQFRAQLRTAGFLNAVFSEMPASIEDPINIEWNSPFVTPGGPLSEHARRVMGLTTDQMNTFLASARTTTL